MKSVMWALLIGGFATGLVALAQWANHQSEIFSPPVIEEAEAYQFYGSFCSAGMCSTMSARQGETLEVCLARGEQFEQGLQEMRDNQTLDVVSAEWQCSGVAAPGPALEDTI